MFILEIILQVVFEILILGISYWTGVILISILTLGSVRLAPFSSYGAKLPKFKRGERRNFFWIYGPRKKRLLHPRVTAIVGFLFWAVLVAVYFLKG